MGGVLAKGSPLREFVKSRVADLSSLALGTITHVETEERAMALTFDDGPHPEYTPRLLDRLAEGNARATFFVVGRAAAAHPGIIERAVREGHCVANHSWDHTSIPLLDSTERREQIVRCQSVLPANTPRLFRPPWGHQTWGSRLDTARAGFDVVAWSVMAEDWLDDRGDLLLERLEKGLRPGAIALLHDALYRTIDVRYEDRNPTLEAIDKLLNRHQDEYRFVTVPELMELGRVRRWPWRVPPDRDWIARQI